MNADKTRRDGTRTPHERKRSQAKRAAIAAKYGKRNPRVGR